MNGQKQYREDLLVWCHETAKSLSEQLELLYRESNGFQEEIEVDSLNRLEMEEQIQIEEDYLVTHAFQDGLEIETDQYIDTEELNQYREDLLNWCNILYSNWNRTKPRLSNHVDNESLEGWESMCSRLKENLQEGLSLDYEDYATANTLYEQWEQFLEESYSYQEDREL
ncbi:hypothetical protein [Neobacillus niacini]|uniref:hypothetical protein n=1 Tax=Neobacillus niacini TaxID=86668 RepID=UPI00203B67AE|nr:hypothetical protein [Neobacillus niacini]MCM3690807.1 hypothetical protein [Neobacillus niacini]